MKFKFPKKTAFLLFFSVAGPGLITALADNDAGGISTYSIVGARYGFSLLWMLLLITLSLAITQEMGARMGAITGKGLAELIREQFGVKLTMFAMLTLILANLATTVSEFAGVAASLELFGLSKYLTIPLIALGIWLLVLRGNFKRVQNVFLAIGAIYLTYIASGFLVHPPWGQIARQAVTPSFSFSPGYVLAFIATIGTTITPWGQFFIQSYVVDKGIKAKDYAYEKIDVYFGAFVTNFIAFFIIICTASTLFKAHIPINDAKDAALALRPLAGRFAQTLFAVGLLNASVLGASILPLATSYSVCEAFGWESGVNTTFRDAPIFNGLYTFILLFGAVFAMIPKLPLILVMLFAQDVNGILLPIILIFTIIIINDRSVMGKYTNSKFFNVIAVTTIAALILLTFILLVTSFLGLGV